MKHLEICYNTKVKEKDFPAFSELTEKQLDDLICSNFYVNYLNENKLFCEGHNTNFFKVKWNLCGQCLLLEPKR